ncbi:MAG: translation initiation factor IF-2 [Planctomycetes bacterium]|nr:translation initiation factor IF-2 [Planctomycetota bacterium]
MRVYQLAEELKVTPDELIQKANGLKIQVKSDISSLDPKAIAKLRKEIEKDQKAAAAKQAAALRAEKKAAALKEKEKAEETAVPEPAETIEPALPKAKPVEPKAPVQPAKPITHKTEKKPVSHEKPVPAHTKPAAGKHPATKETPIAPITIGKHSEPVAKPTAKPGIPHPKTPLPKDDISKSTPIIPTLAKESDDKDIRAMHAKELDLYSKGTTDESKGIRGKVISMPATFGKQKPFIKKTFFFKKKSSGQPHQQIINKPVERKVTISGRITLKELCEKMGVKANIIIKKLMEHNIMTGINDPLSEDALVLIGLEFNYEIIFEKTKDIDSQLVHTTSDKPEDLKSRPPVVTFMGHVDHGKTSLMDKIRSANVAASEHGAITQHLGAYEAEINNRKIVFLDTPGHEAFTQMRSRGANVTDIVVIVVAADDGVMPQTEEAISHARAANLPIIVAINKVDKKEANLHKVRQQLSSMDLTPEDWGGKTIFAEVSALTGQGIDHLLEMILLQSDMMELKANPNRRAYGTVMEAKLTESQGPLTTILVQNGTLKIGDIIFCGGASGKVRSMLNSRSESVTETPPSTVVRISGLSDLPMAGDKFYVMDSIQTASEMAQTYIERKKTALAGPQQHTTLENLYDKIATSQLKEIKVILKTDVQGSLEVITQLLNNFAYKEAKVKIIHRGVGQINESDVLLAHVSDALIIGFNTSVEDRAKTLVTDHGVDVKIYNVIYDIVENIKLALEGMLEPEKREVSIGKLTVKDLFKISRLGTIAGCTVIEGKIERSSLVRVYRDKNVIYEGKLSSLKRFKDDVREVNTGFECGLRIDGFDNLNTGDIIEAFQIEKYLKKLTASS